MAESDTILQLGIEAAREGNREEARNLFGLLTRQEPDNLQAWLWLAGVAEGPEQRRAALERVLALDPTNEMAQKGLQAMGVVPTSRREEFVPPPAIETPPPLTPSRTMTDEERYAAELDSAFDDYDSVPRVETPRVTTILEDESVPAATTPAERPVLSSRERAERRAADRREANRSRTQDRDPVIVPIRSGPSPLLLGLLGLIVLALIIFLVFRFLGGGGGQDPQIAANETATALASGVGGTPVPGTELTPTIEGGGTEAPTAVVEPTVTAPLTPTDVLTPTAAPEAPTAVPPPGELASANPAPVPIDTTLDANGWGYRYPNICGVACATILGNQISSFTTQGSYIVVLVAVANNSGNPQPLPRDFFVLKDGQGNIYEPLPEVSNAYVQRGLNADVGMQDQIPANGVFTSVPLIFDVRHGATNLALFSRYKTDQGWVVLNNVP